MAASVSFSRRNISVEIFARLFVKSFVGQITFLNLDDVGLSARVGERKKRHKEQIEFGSLLVWRKCSHRFCSFIPLRPLLISARRLCQCEISPCYGMEHKDSGGSFKSDDLARRTSRRFADRRPPPPSKRFDWPQLIGRSAEAIKRTVRGDCLSVLRELQMSSASQLQPKQQFTSVNYPNYYSMECQKDSPSIRSVFNLHITAHNLVKYGRPAPEATFTFAYSHRGGAGVGWRRRIAEKRVNAS